MEKTASENAPSHLSHGGTGGPSILWTEAACQRLLLWDGPLILGKWSLGEVPNVEEDYNLSLPSRQQRVTYVRTFIILNSMKYEGLD